MGDVVDHHDVPLLGMDHLVVCGAQQHHVGQGGVPAVGPVLAMMSFCPVWGTSHTMGSCTRRPGLPVRGGWRW